MLRAQVALSFGHSPGRDAGQVHDEALRYDSV
jgi:hypothetical protein